MSEMRARIGRIIRHTLDVFILCSKIIMENRWEKSPVLLVSHCDKQRISSLDTSANSARTRDELTQYPEEIHRDGDGCVASLWVAMVASAMMQAVKVCAAADVCREMTRLDRAAARWRVESLSLHAKPSPANAKRHSCDTRCSERPRPSRLDEVWQRRVPHISAP
jgi:hypothetical protein